MTIKEIIKQLEEIREALENNGSNQFKLDVVYENIDYTIKFLRLKGSIKNQTNRIPYR